VAQTLPAPTMVSPAAGESFDHFPRTTFLRWLPVSGAASYTVELDCFHCCGSGKWCTEQSKLYGSFPRIATTYHEFGWVGAQPGRWRVFAVGPDGKPGAPSPWREFRYTR
jgi:hypothetical protein